MQVVDSLQDLRLRKQVWMQATLAKDGLNVLRVLSRAPLVRYRGESMQRLFALIE